MSFALRSHAEPYGAGIRKMSKQAIAMSGDAKTVGNSDSKAALSRARAFETRARSTVQSLSGKFAWATVVVFLGILAAGSTVAAPAIPRHNSYWVAIPLNTRPV